MEAVVEAGGGFGEIARGGKANCARHGPETDQEFVWVYRTESEGPFELHPDEIDRGNWFSPEEVNRWMKEKPEEFASALLFIWKKI